MRRMRLVAMVTVLALVGSGCVWVGLVSTDATGGQITVNVQHLDVSGDGSYVLFTTEAALVAGDTNGTYDIYRKHLASGAVDLISQSTGGAPGNGESRYGAMSDDAGVIAFASDSTNLVPLDTNASTDVFVHTIATGETERISLTSTGQQVTSNSSAPAISGNGEVAAFATGALLVPGMLGGFPKLDVFAFDLTTDTLRLVSTDAAGNDSPGAATHPSVDFDGDRIAFDASDGTLVAGDTNGFRDVFVKLASGPILLASTPVGGGVALGGDSGQPSIAGNGLAVAFDSWADNLVPGDTNNRRDVFVNPAVGSVVRASIADDGVTQGTGNSFGASMDHSGTLVAFVSRAPEINGGTTSAEIGVVRDGRNERTVPVRLSDFFFTYAWTASLSADGNYVVMSVPGPVNDDDTDTAIDVAAVWWSEPVIDSVTPSDLPLDDKTDITISGSGFRPGAWVYTTFVNGADGLEFSDVTIVDSSTITATISVEPGAALGSKLLSVQGLGTADGPFSGGYNNCSCLNVVP